MPPYFEIPFYSQLILDSDNPSSLEPTAVLSHVNAPVTAASVLRGLCHHSPAPSVLIHPLPSLPEI